MLEEPFLTINPSHARNQHKIFRTNLPAQSPEGGKPFGRSFGKERGVERENPFYRKKWVLSLHKVYQLSKAELLPKSWGKSYFLISLFNAERFSGATFDKEAAALFSFWIAS